MQLTLGEVVTLASAIGLEIEQHEEREVMYDFGGGELAQERVRGSVLDRWEEGRQERVLELTSILEKQNDSEYD